MAQPPDFERRFGALQACADDPVPEDAWSRFTTLQTDFEQLADPVRGRLLGSAFAWADEDKTQARWLHRLNDDFAALGCRLAEGFAKRLGVHDELTRRMMARALFFMGETVKWEVAVAPEAPHDFRKPHALMRDAMALGHHREPMSLRVDGREAACTLESLYFRILLLARFSGGALSAKQIEILDAWLWLWMPALCGVPTPPPGSALRADLDSADGLRLGPREDDGPSLYLPQGPLDEAYRALVANFHAGRIVPSEGRAAEFRVEEHVAVLGLIRRSLRESKRSPVARAVRHPSGRTVEMLVGLAELTRQGFAAAAPVAPAFALAVVAGREVDPSRLVRDRDAALGEIYDAERRLVRLVNESDSGLGLEGAQADCGSIAAGDLVAVRPSADEPLMLGKVVRSAPSRTPGRVVVGVRRLAAGAQLVGVKREHSERPAEDLTLIFVPGGDAGGRHDSWLVSERSYSEAGALVACLEGATFTFRFNRVRERGRGWVLAGFEVIAARPAAESA